MNHDQPDGSNGHHNGHHHSDNGHRNGRVNEPDLSAVDDMLFAIARGSTRQFGTWLKGLYLDGRAFAEEEDSQRWQNLIESHPLYQATSVLWSLANLDRIVLGADDPAPPQPPPTPDSED